MKIPITEKEIVSITKRMNLMPSLVRRHIEEEVISLVQLPPEWHENAFQEFLKGEELTQAKLDSWLNKKGWTKDDLKLHLARPEALYRFSKQRFGPGLEEKYLSNAADMDTVIYSLVRVRDPMLANELWMRLSEEEVSFVDVASIYGEGPEAKRKGIIGPIAFGMLQPPIIRDMLRELAPGEFTSPKNLGEWNILMRLEQLSPSSFDQTTRDSLLKEQLDTFMDNRSIALLNEEPLEPLHYDPEL